MMSFMQAMAILQGGGRVRRAGWEGGCRYSLSIDNPNAPPSRREKIWLHDADARSSIVWVPNTADLFTDDWVSA